MNNPFEDTPCLYFVIDGNGIIAEVNNDFCRQTGYERKELVGQKADKIFSVSTRIFQQTHLFPLLKMQGRAEEIYIDLQTREQESLPVLINVERKEMNGESIIVFVGIVVHNRKKFEDELVAAKKAAEKALSENTALLQTKQELQETIELLDEQMVLVRKQNEEFRQFNRVVTHDLQEPLRKLFVFTNRLLEEKDEKQIDANVLKIKSVSEKMRAVVSGLQQYVWLTEAPLKRTVVNLQEQLNSLQEQLKKEHPALTINVVAGELPMLEADADQIRFLLEEILRNAVRFRKSNNDVTIKIAATESVRNRFAAVPGKYRYENYIKLQISDNGTGFDATYKDQVFELFKRLHSESGLGVGLALCKKIAENHQGNIAVHSIPGEGTTLSILLPLREQSQSPVTNENMIQTPKISGNDD